MRKNIKKQDSKQTEMVGLVYARVSSRNQRNEGHGLESQEQRCIERLRYEHIPYEKTFKDSFTGGGDFMKRPAMRELLAYIDDNPHKNFAVIFDDLKRFARDRKFHWELKTAFISRSIKLICLNYEFNDSPEGEFVESVLSAQNELERKQNARQVIQKQQARLKNGYWPFCAPLGYRKIKDAIHGTLDTPTHQSIYIKQALEGFAQRRYLHKIDAVRFLQEKGIISNKQSANKGIITFTNMLTNPFYAGYIEYPKWEVERRVGHHKGIISLDTFKKNQILLIKNNSAFVRQDVREDFLLRGLVNCAKCGEKLTGANSRGKMGKLYAYYKCPNKRCMAYGKSIKAEDIHNGFEELIKQIKASQNLQTLALAIFEDAWEEEMRNIVKMKKEVVKRKQVLEKQITQLTLLATQTASTNVLRQYEKQIEKYGEEIEEIEDYLNGGEDYSLPYRTSMKEVIQVLENPYSAWQNYNVYQKQKFFSFIFDKNLEYDKIGGYRTPNYSLPITLFETINNNEPDMVETTGIEPMSKSVV